MITKGVFLLGVGALALGFATTTAAAAELFTLKSTTFADSKMMPTKVANSQQCTRQRNAAPLYFRSYRNRFRPQGAAARLDAGRIDRKVWPSAGASEGHNGNDRVVVNPWHE